MSLPHRRTHLLSISLASQLTHCMLRRHVLQKSPWAHTLIVRLPTSAVPYERILRTNPYCCAVSVDPSSPQLLIGRLTLPHPPSPITLSPDFLFGPQSSVPSFLALLGPGTRRDSRYSPSRCEMLARLCFSARERIWSCRLWCARRGAARESS